MFGRSRRSHGPTTGRDAQDLPRALAADPRLDEPNLLYLLGDPVAHSLSPTFQNAALAAIGSPWRYVARRVSSEGLPSALRGLRQLGTAGANLTIPHKIAGLAHVDSVDRDAGIVGAINTLSVRDGRLHGSNSDIDGFLDALQTMRPKGLSAPGVILVGSGGAARAVGWALVRSGMVETVVVASRNGERGQLMINALRDGQGRRGSARLRFDLVDSADAVGEDMRAGVGLLVNATPVGMAPQADHSPISRLDGLPAGALVFDLVYGAGTAPLIRMAHEHGLDACDGREMLLHQGARSFEAWTGQNAPLEVMREALMHEKGRAPDSAREGIG